MILAKSNSERAALQAAFTLVWLYVAGMCLLLGLGVGLSLVFPAVW